MKLALRIAATLVLTGGLLAFWLHGQDLRELGGRLSSAHGGWLAVAVIAGFLALPARAWRWRALLDVGAEPPGFMPLLSATSLGFSVNFLAPGRLGEIIRPALLSLRSPVPLSVSLASVVVERLLDLMTLLVLLVVFLVASPGIAGPELHRGILVGAVGGALGLAAFVAVHATQRNRLDALVSRLARLLPGRLAVTAERFGMTFLQGFDALLRPGAWWRLPLLSLITWSPPLLTVHAACRAAGADIPWTAPLLVLGFAAAGIAIPTPAGVGGYHALVTAALALFAVPGETGAAAALLAHAASVLTVLVQGLYFFVRDGVSIDRLKAALRLGRSEAESARAHERHVPDGPETSTAVDDVIEPSEVESQP